MASSQDDRIPLHRRLGLRTRVRDTWRRWRARFTRPHWIIEPAPLAAQKVCLLACFSADGALSRHVVDLSRAWHAEGFRVVLIVACEIPERFAVDPARTSHLAGLLLRRNEGYDFGSWGAGLAACREIRSASLLALANDSVYGPLRGFDALLGRVDASTADVVALTDNFERVHHVQSYLVFYKPRALRSRTFERFWRHRQIGGREDVIRDAELPLLSKLEAGGLRVEVLFPAERYSRVNATLVRWRELLHDGFPFVKMQLLRDNPFDADLSGWESELQRHGYEPSRVIENLGERFTTSAAAKATADASAHAPSPAGGRAGTV